MESNCKTTVRKTIPATKKFSFPSPLVIVEYQKKVLVISRDIANWIVIQNKTQLEFFQLLEIYALNEALLNFHGRLEDAKYVVTQIIARRFENKKVHSKHVSGTMQLYLTNACNMRCPHCYMFAGIKKKNELTTEEVCSLLSKFRESGGQVVVFSGGEIALRSDLQKIIKYSYKLGIKNEILTNGTLWTESMIEELSPMLTRVQISIDGYSEETNSLIRGKDNFGIALNTADSFLKHNVYTEISVTPYLDENLAVNYHRYVEFAQRLYEKYNASNFMVKFTFDILEGRDIVVTKEQKEQYQTIISKIYNELYGDFMDRPFMSFHLKGGLEDNCDYGNLAISSDGNVVLCPIIQQVKPIGNIRTDDMVSLFEIAKKARELSNVNNLMPCKKCELKYICGGDCRVKHFKGFMQSNLQMMTNSERVCSTDIKNFFYDMMIRLNEQMFR